MLVITSEFTIKNKKYFLNSKGGRLLDNIFWCLLLPSVFVLLWLQKNALAVCILFGYVVIRVAYISLTGVTTEQL